VFELSGPIQSPAKCEVRSVIRSHNAKGERPAEIHKQIVAVYGNVMNRNMTKLCREFSEGRTDVHDEHRSSRPSLMSDDLAFGGTLDRRCHFKHVSLKKRQFNQCQTSTAHRLKIKVDASVAIISIKIFPIGLHVMYLYFPDTPRIFSVKQHSA